MPAGALGRAALAEHLPGSASIRTPVDQRVSP